MFEFLDTPRYAQWNIKVHYSQFTGEWNIEGKSYDRSNVKAYSTYGTSRINAYKIIEETLNLKDVRIFDYIEDDEGKKKAVLNKKETAIAQAKQELIKQGFQDWIWADPARREKLTKMYNEKFNSIRPREYDGSHISEQFHRELITPFVDPFEQAEEERIEEEKEQLRQLEIAKVRKVLEMLKPVQRERMIKAILLGMSSRKIAKEEGVYYSVVDKSIAAARKNFKKFYENL